VKVWFRLHQGDGDARIEPLEGAGAGSRPPKAAAHHHDAAAGILRQRRPSA